MSDTFLRASLRLWRWRLHRHHDKLKTAVKAHDGKEQKRLKALIVVDHHRIDLRLVQLKAWKTHHAPHGHRLWMPGAERRDRSGTPWQVDCPPRGVLHITAGHGDPTPTLDAKRAWSGFAVLEDGTKIQYISMAEGDRSLIHSEGTPTNGAHAKQIEIACPTLDAVRNLPAAQVKSLKEIMRFIEENGSVERACNVSFAKPVRLTNAAWLAIQGWVGHCHVPQNDHPDPGPIDIQELLAHDAHS